jgi:hypothetical protein
MLLCLPQLQQLFFLSLMSVGNDHHQPMAPTNQPPLPTLQKCFFFLSFIYLFLHTHYSPAEITAAAAAAMTTTPFKINPMTTENKTEPPTNNNNPL